MYQQHFGLEHEPFSIAPDPRYLYLGERHREALAHLTYGLSAGGGFVLLTGEIGAGKTTVCRCFLEQVPADCHIAYIFNPKLTSIELLASICEEFGIPVAPPPAPTIKTFLDPLNRFLLDEHAAGRNSVLVIDEAQALSAEVLEQLRLLTNLETSERKLLQIILVGQPELRAMLAQPGLEQLAQRVIARYHLGPLDEADTGRYLQHRLEMAGLHGASPLPPALWPAIHRLSGGIPRRINRLCDRALLGAFGQGMATVDRATLRRAAREVEDEASSKGGRGDAALAAPGPGRLAIAALTGAAVGIATLLVWREPPRDMSPLAAAPATAALGPREPQDAAGVQAMAAPAGVAAAAASAPSSAPATPIGLSELRRLLLSQPLTEQAAWRQLAELWGAPLAEGDACRAAARQRLGCYRGNGGIALVRQLGRPGVLDLGGVAGDHLLLVGLDANSATVQLGGERRKLPLIDLASIWSGGFATFWRVPDPLLQPAPADGSEPLAGWLSEQLAAIDGEPPRRELRRIDPVLRERLTTFQRANGLDADGIPGPLTLMALHRATGVDEPRLRFE